MNTDTRLTDTALELTRTFDAPRELVFDAWVDPERAKEWSGCEGSQILSIETDLRVGGESRTRMVIPGAGEMTAVATYTEVDPPRRIAYRLAWEPAIGGESPDTLITVEFEDLGGKTQVRLTQSGFMSPEMKGSVEKNWRLALESFGQSVSVSPTGIAAP